MKKYNKAIDTIKELNMTKRAWENCKNEWNNHRTALAVPFFNVKNYQKLRERAEGNLLLTEEIKYDYAVTAGQWIFLNSGDSP